MTNRWWERRWHQWVLEHKQTTLPQPRPSWSIGGIKRVTYCECDKTWTER